MNKHPTYPLTYLDQLVTSQNLQLLKLLLPYIPVTYRNMLAIYLKLIEFQNTLRLFSKSPNAGADEPIKSKNISSPLDLIADLRGLFSPEEASSIDSILSMISMMQMMQSENDMSDSPKMNENSEYSEMFEQFDSLLKGMEPKNE